MTESSPVDVVNALSRALLSGDIGLRRQTAHELSKDNPNHVKLVIAANESHRILLKATTVFPFNLFPDSVTIDREKLTFANRVFFRAAKIVSVPIRDILSVEADVGPLFGSVYITIRDSSTNPLSICYLWREDALKLQRLLQGYISAFEREIDCSRINESDLLELLNNLGQSDVS